MMKYVNKILELISKFRVWGMRGVVDYFLRIIHWRKRSRDLARIAKKKSLHPPRRGITLIGEFFTHSSNSKTFRDFALQLRDAGIPFQICPTDAVRKTVDPEILELVVPCEDFRLDRYSHVVEMFRSPLPCNLVPRRARIAFWEGLHGILDVWPFLGNGEPVIAMSDFNEEYFKRDLDCRVDKITYPLRRIGTDIPSRTGTRRRFGIKEDDFAVFFNFDFGSYRRKNPLAAIKAFSLAFPDDSGTVLVFKTMGANKHPRHVKEVKDYVRDLGIASRFRMIAEYVPQKDLYALTAACDVYISLHRGEGFGLGMAEAMLMGRPVIATAWSANTEFCRPDNSLCVGCELVDVKADEYFTSMGQWAEPDVEEAARHLKRCRDDRDFAEEIGRKGKAFVEEHFSLENFKASVEKFLGDGGDVHVVVAANHRYARGLEATLASMVHSSAESSRLCFHVFDDGLEKADKKRLEATLGRLGYVRGIDYRKADDARLLEGFSEYNGSRTTYLRLFFPDIFSELDWVIWADVDTLWFRDACVLWDERDPSKSVLWSKDIPSSRIHAKKIAKWRPDRDENRYACAGVMLMNLKKMRETSFVEKAVAFVKKWGSPHYADQDILNEICYDDAKFVDGRWDCMFPDDGVDSGVVIHFNGIGPYFSGERDDWFFPLFEIWFRFYGEVVEGKRGYRPASPLKRAIYGVLALAYPFHKGVAAITSRIHPWGSDFIQRLLFFSYLRRKRLWK